MRLHRITRPGLAELRHRLAAGEELAAIASAAEEHWSEPHPAEIDLTKVSEQVEQWRPDPNQDPDHAVELHSRLPIPRRVAADSMIWPWLAGIHFARHTQSRWSRDDRKFNAQRIGTDSRRNAFARLWWTAELSHVDNPRALCEALELTPSDDPYHFARLLLATRGLLQELTDRNQLTDRAILVAILTFVHHEKLVRADVREMAKSLNLLFSTTVVGGFERAGPEVGRHHVDPTGCRDLLEYLRNRLFEPPDQPTVEAPRPESGVKRMFSWLRGGKPGRRR